MLRGLTTAASGMIADERLQQLLTNNIANIDTPGYKASDGEMLLFPQALLQRMNDYGDPSVKTPIGKLGTGVVMQEGIPLFLQGDLASTGRNLDVAIVDSTPAGEYAVVSAPGTPGTVGPTGTTTNGQTAANGAQAAAGQVASVMGSVIAGPGGRLEINGQPLAVIDANGNPIAGVYAAKNPAYQGNALIASDGKPDYDANGNSSYLFVNGQNAAIAQPGQTGWENAAVRVGTQLDMGNHTFFAVQYQSGQASGIALTRDGHLDVNNQHELIDAAGNTVLPVDQNGQPINGARIVLNQNYQGKDIFSANGSPVLDSAGQPSYKVVDQNGNPIANAHLGTVDVDVTKLTPLGESEFMVGQTLSPAAVLPQLRVSTGSLKPGSEEKSNVDATATMTQMMAVISQYEANQRVIQTEDSLLSKAVSDVGKVNA